MESKILLSLALAVLIVGSVFAVAPFSAAVKTSGDPVLGPYSFTLGSDGMVSDLIYSDGQNSTVLINDMSVNGSSSLNISAAGAQNVNRAGLDQVAITNGTMYYQDQLNGLGIVTYSNISGSYPPAVVHPQISIDFNNALEKMPLSYNSSLEGPFGDYLTQDLLLQMDTNWSLYRINNTIFDGYFFTNGAVSLSNSNMTADIQGTANRVSNNNVYFSILVAGLISSGDLMQLLNNYMYRHQNYHTFTYNPQTGLVSGQYMSFYFNPSTGAITSLNAKLPSTTPIFSSIVTYGNGTLGSPFMMPYLTLNQVLIFGSIFYYANSTYVYGMHNNPSLQMNLVLNNGTMEFTVPADMNVTAISLPHGMQNGYNLSYLRSDVNQYLQYGIGTTNQVIAGGQTMLLYNSGIHAFLTVSGGSAVFYASNHTISVSTPDLAVINFVMPPGLNNLGPGPFQALKYAYQHGLISGQIACDYLNGTPLNYSFLYNNSLDLKFLGSSPGQVKFQASSGLSQGTSVAFYVNNTYLNSTGKVYVYVDGQAASLSSNVNSVLNSTQSTPVYAYIAVQNGYMVIVHLPSFSAHNITVSGSQVGPGGGGIPLWAIISIAVVVLGAAGVLTWFLYRRR